MKTAAAFHSSIVQQGQLLPGIHGLRGVAALAVVLFHLVHLANISVPPGFSFIANDFGKGVHLFFVLSAFSLMHSTEHTLSRPSWMKEYFIKRFFRIAPLYYCILASMVLWPLVKSHSLAVSLQSLFLNLTFTFGFAPWTGIVWAGWTVGVEMLFYAIFPTLLLTVRSRKGMLLLVVISVLVTYAARSALQAHYEHTVSLYRFNWAYFSFPSNLCYFALGMYSFRIAREAGPDAATMHWGVPVFATTLLGILLFAGTYYNAFQPDLILWGFGFAALTLWQSKWPSYWCANRLFEHLGERSYSLYLLHPVVIVLLKSPIQRLYGMLTPTMGAYAYFICAIAILFPLLLLSETTYRLIEIPAIRYGQRINASLRKASLPADAHDQAGVVRQDAQP